MRDKNIMVPAGEIENKWRAAVPIFAEEDSVSVRYSLLVGCTCLIGNCNNCTTPSRNIHVKRGI